MFANALKRRGPDSLNKATQILQAHDTDGDGCLSFQEAINSSLNSNFIAFSI